MNDEHVTEIMGELCDLIVAKYPGKSVCVDCESWQAGRADEYRRKETDGEEKGTDTVERPVEKTDEGHC
jgi:hypothetical protein